MKESRTTALVHFSSVVGRYPTPGASSKLRQEWPVYSFQMPPDPILFFSGAGQVRPDGVETVGRAAEKQTFRGVPLL
jgi:hypothetical protein